jgi:hypothetical protein
MFDTSNPGKFAKSQSAPHDTYNRGTRGSVTWSVTYGDVNLGNGLGFDDPIQGSLRRANLLAVLAYVDSVLNPSFGSTIDIELGVSQTDGSGFLAAAGTFFSLATGFSTGVAATHIQTGTDPAPAIPDIFVVMDFGYPWQADQSLVPSGSQFDLFSVLLHEITHGLGMLSLVSPTGVSEISGTDPGAYSMVDAFMEKDDAGDIGTGSTTDLFTAGADFVGTPADLTSNRVVVTAPTAASILGSNPRLFAPGIYNPGSSLSHWDTGTYPTSVMKHAISPGTTVRMYLPFEIGMLFDLGYTGAAVLTPTLNFSKSNYDVFETDGSKSISVNLSPASAAGSVSVMYSTSADTATAGSDYTEVSGTLTWLTGESGTKSFSVPVATDATIEPTETVDLNLGGITGNAVLGAMSTSTLTIIDPDNDYVLSVPFYLDNASNFIGAVVPSDGTASFVGVKNTSAVPVTLTITYTDTDGIDRTPANNTYVLPGNSTVSWRPFADDPIEGPAAGQLVPNTDGGPPWGSVLIRANGPISGRLITQDGIQRSTALMVMPKGGGALTLSVPFYLDNGANFVGGTPPNNGTASFIAVKNMRNVPVTITLTYTDAEGLDHTPANNTYVIPSNAMVSWRPFADDPVEGPTAGQLVPNTDGGPPWGSVLIQADGPITGRLIHLDGIENTTGLMLLPNE